MIERVEMVAFKLI